MSGDDILGLVVIIGGYLYFTVCTILIGRHLIDSFFSNKRDNNYKKTQEILPEVYDDPVFSNQVQNEICRMSLNTEQSLICCYEIFAKEPRVFYIQAELSELQNILNEFKKPIHKYESYNELYSYFKYSMNLKVMTEQEFKNTLRVGHITDERNLDL